MAVTQSDKTSRVTLQMEVATETYENRIINKVNPTLSDANVYKFFSGDSTGESSYPYGLAYYLTGSLNKITRTNSFTLTNE